MTLLQTGIITSGFRQDTRDNVLTAAELRRWGWDSHLALGRLTTTHLLPSAGIRRCCILELLRKRGVRCCRRQQEDSPFWENPVLRNEQLVLSNEANEEKGTWRVPNPAHLRLHFVRGARGAPRVLGKLASVLLWDRLPSDCGPCQARRLAHGTSQLFWNAIIYRFVNGIWNVCLDSTKYSLHYSALQGNTSLGQKFPPVKFKWMLCWHSSHCFKSKRLRTQFLAVLKLDEVSYSKEKSSDHSKEMSTPRC